MMRSKLLDKIVSFFCIGILLMYPMLVFAATITDTTCAAGQFGGGTDSDTQCSSDQVELDATGKINGSGSFTSRIMNAGSSATWSGLGWTPTQPYLKELPNSGSSESAYSSGNVDMTNIEGLWHLNESSGNLLDSSGNNRDAVATGGPVYSSSAIFSTGLDFDGSNDRIADADFPFLGTAFTISVWVKVENIGDSYYSAVSKGAVFDNNTNFAFGMRDRLGSQKKIFMYYSNGGTLYGTESQTLPNNMENNWHHIMVTFDTNDSNRIVLYYDGMEVDNVTKAAGPTDGSQELRIGGPATSDSSDAFFPGVIDEVAIWSEALNSNDALALYKRGALRLKYQVRSCDDDACSGESFLGPDGTGSTYYSELTSAEVGLPSKTLSNVSDNQYFQYKAYFETSSSTLTPELLDVTVTYSGGGGGGVPEFSDALYVVTVLFGVFYLSKNLQLPREA